jgi:histidyl-tRNA synthetase
MAQSVKGTRDLFGNELRWFQYIESTARCAFGHHGYTEIRTPILEDINVFQRSIGASSDIIHKEMYDFVDKGGRHITMRPENTAGVVRAILQHKLLAYNDPQLLYYIGPMFRYERMQAGRFRQFWQIGAESIAVSSPESEAESMVLLYDLLQKLGLYQLKFSINSVGNSETRLMFKDAFRIFFETRQDRFCADCHRRINENPMRVLDCKTPNCQEALIGHPSLINYLDISSRKHHERIKELLTELKLPFEENPRLVRGLDYYTHTVFEVLSNNLGAQSAILGGGRYDGLFQQLGGPSVPSFGWSIGLDRLVMLLQQQYGNATYNTPVLLVPLGNKATTQAFTIVRNWWKQDLNIQLDTRGMSLKRALTTANRLGIQIVLILGENEIEQGTISIKYLNTGKQETCDIGEATTKLHQLSNKLNQIQLAINHTN